MKLISELFGRRHRQLLVAHRGFSANFVENSYASFEAAQSLPVDVIETDARSTRDGVAVILHDPDFEQVAGIGTPISELTWDEVSKIYFRDGSHPLRVQDLLTLFPKALFNIDLKDADAVNGVYSALMLAEAGDRVCVSSFSDSRLSRFRRISGGRVATSLSPVEVARLRLLASTRVGLVSASADLHKLRNWVISSPAGLSEKVLAAQVPLRIAKNRMPLVTPAFVALAHLLGLDVHVWTINNMDIAQRLVSGWLGVDAIMTDYAEDVARLMHRL